MTTTKKRPSKKTISSKKIIKAKKSKSSGKSVHYKSFELTSDVKPFMLFRFTDQTVYWLALTIIILVMWIWSLSTQINTINAVDNIIKLY